MRFEVQWHAIVGPYRLNVSDVEIVEAPTFSAALSLLRAPIIRKLCSLNCVFFLTSLTFKNLPQDTNIALRDQNDFLNSVNAEGGMARNVPRGPADHYQVTRDEQGNISVTPLLEPPQGRAPF